MQTQLEFAFETFQEKAEETQPTYTTLSSPGGTTLSAVTCAGVGGFTPPVEIPAEPRCKESAAVNPAWNLDS